MIRFTRIMNKAGNKTVISALVIVLILVVGGFFWWQEIRETPPEKWMTAKVSPREEYIIREILEEKIVENEKVGLSFKIPKNWIIKETPFFLPDLTFYSPEVEINKKRNDLLQNGCRINMAVAYIKTNLETLEKDLKEKELFGQLSIINEHERVEISNLTAIKHLFEIENLKMSFTVIHLPFKNKLYEMGLAAAFQDKEDCGVEFNKFLETVLIEPR